MYEVYLTKNAYKNLKLLDEKIRGRIKEVLRKLTSFPDGLDVKKLKGFKNKYRIRVGDITVATGGGMAIGILLALKGLAIEMVGVILIWRGAVVLSGGTIWPGVNWP